MIGAAPQGLDLTQVIVASITGASLVAAAAVTAFLTFGRRNAREGARQGAKEGARQGALENHAETMDALDTGNLMKIGAYVHDMAGTVELLQAQSHDFGRRQDEMHGAILEAREYFWSDKIIAGMASIGVLGLLIDLGMSRLNGWLLRWHRGLEG